jgi:hypothetical protein
MASMALARASGRGFERWIGVATPTYPSRAITFVIHSNMPRSASAAAKHLERGDADSYPRDARVKPCDDIPGIVHAEVQAAERHNEAP